MGNVGFRVDAAKAIARGRRKDNDDRIRGCIETLKECFKAGDEGTGAFKDVHEAISDLVEKTLANRDKALSQTGADNPKAPQRGGKRG